MKTIISWSIALVLLATGMVSAYHVPEQDDTNAPGFVTRSWTSGNGLFTACESLGPTDPVNDNPAGPFGGIGGVCYASSQQFWNESTLKWDVDAKKQKKIDDAVNQTVWSYFRPVCELRDLLTGQPTGIACPSTTNKTLLPDWFARVGSNAHGCNGAWGQEFRYKELLAYYHGSQPNNVTGASGHVAFFVQDLDTFPNLAEGTYHNGKNTTGGGAPDPVKSDGLCSGSNFVGLGDCADRTEPKMGEANYGSDCRAHD